MKNIATIAHGVHKPDKADAQRILRDIAADNPELIVALAPLYSYFMPRHKKKPKTDFEWVALAVGAKDTRAYLNNVWVDKDWVMASDGSRAHQVPNSEGLAPGWYSPIGDKLDIDPGKFPAKTLCSLLDPGPKIPFYDLFDLEIVNVGKDHAYRLPTRGDGIRVKYLDEAVDGNRLEGQGYDGAITVIEYGNRTAGIMPVRL